MPRLIIIGLLVGLTVWVIHTIWKNGKFKLSLPKRKNRCPKCDGLGYWEALRGKEKCNLCKGTGEYLQD